MTCGDSMLPNVSLFPNAISLLYLNVKKHKSLCVLNCCFKVPKLQIKSSFVGCSTHSQSLLPCSIIKTVQSQINILKHAAFYQERNWKLCMFRSSRITKSHSSPAHVNETRAPLAAWKASLSGDGHNFIRKNPPALIKKLWLSFCQNLAIPWC